MKIHKIYEKLHTNAGKFKVFISTFFEELEEFDNVHYHSTDGENWRFTIRFNEVYKDTIQQMEEFNEFMGFVKDGWSFKIDEDEHVIYEEFYLGTDKIEIFLKKAEILNKANKYNL